MEEKNLSSSHIFGWVKGARGMVLREKLRGFLEEFKDCGIGGKLLVLYILISPIIDILTSIGRREFHITISAGIILKGILLALVLFFYFKEKSQNRLEQFLKGILVLFVLYGMIHLWLAYAFYGLSRALVALVTLVKTFYLPLLSISLYKLISREDLPLIKRTLFYSVAFIIGSIIIAMLTGTGYASYRWIKMGTVGWFYAGNALSATLALLTPFVVYYVMEKARMSIGKSLLIVTLYTWVFYQIGTKVVALSVILTMGFLLLVMILKKVVYSKITVKRYLISLGLLLIISVALVPVSPVGYNINAHQAIVDNHGVDEVVFELEESIIIAMKDNLESLDSLNPPNEGEFSSPESAKDALKRYSFGEMTENQRRLVRLIFSGRDGYFFMRLFHYDHSSFIQKVFGGTQFSVSVNGEIKSYMVEIDYFDIYFNFGFIGTLLYWVMFFAVLINGVYYSLKNKQLFKEGSGIPYYICAIIMAFGIGSFAGHVFVSPAVSFYLAIITTLLILESGVQMMPKFIKRSL